MQDALDRLARDFPVLLKGLELGKMREHCRKYMGNHIQYYWEGAYRVWDSITQHSSTVRCALEQKDVEFLESRAPAVSSADRDDIASRMDSGLLLSKCTDLETRTRIKQSLLRLQVVIPTLKSFHKNMTYLQIGIDIVRDLLCPKIPRPTRRDEPPPTVQAIMERLWEPPKETLVEVREGEFRRTNGGVGGATLAYMIVLISALREFPRLGPERPSAERGQSAMTAMKDPVYVSLLLRRAHLVGFRTPKITVGLTEDFESIVDDGSPLPTDEQHFRDWKHRPGRPSTDAYKRRRKLLYLPDLFRSGSGSTEASVLRDLIDSCFSPEMIDMAKTATRGIQGPVVSLREPTKTPPRRSPSRSLSTAVRALSHQNRPNNLRLHTREDMKQSAPTELSPACITSTLAVPEGCDVSDKTNCPGWAEDDAAETTSLKDGSSATRRPSPSMTSDYPGPGFSRSLQLRQTSEGFDDHRPAANMEVDELGLSSTPRSHLLPLGESSSTSSGPFSPRSDIIPY